jgi:hypothetical protein
MSICAIYSYAFPAPRISSYTTVWTRWISKSKHMNSPIL